MHGQVVEAWIPRLKIDRLIVLDDRSAGDGLTQLAFSMAIPSDVELQIASVDAFDHHTIEKDAKRSLVLFRDIGSAERSLQRGLSIATLNLGNIHSGPGRIEIARTIFLDSADAEALNRIRRSGVEIEIQPTPNDKVVVLSDVLAAPASSD